MTSEPNVDSIFCQAVEIASDAERTDFLQRACGADAEMRARIEKLLAAHFQAGSFMQEGDERTLDVQPPPERPGTCIGPYKLLQVIGEGGMGVVYMAEQAEPLRRKVAVKIIKPGMDTREVIARFEAERQALALMDHPNIAKVLDAGTTDNGRPFFVMELIKGVPLTDYCDRNNLTPERRIELFARVCRAVQHAHQKGIIHRDIKPSNVLITLHDGQPVPKVIDFGVAKAISQQLTEKTLFTHFGQMIGTPAYMSPEQAEMSGLDIDTRSDVYSLGVLLYELLTGTTPFDPDTLRSAGYREMQRIIAEQDPPCPSQKLSTMGVKLTDISGHRSVEPHQLSRLVRGELDWIVMKTLEKDRNRRYDTPGNLAIDVERFLANKPIDAGPPTTWYRLRKLYQRNRATCIALAGGVTALILVAIISSALAIWALQASKQAQQAEARAREYAKSLMEQKERLRRQRYTSDLGAARDAVQRGDTQMSLRLLKRNIPSEGEIDLRGIEWDYLWNLSNARQETTCLHLDVPPSRLAIGTAGRRIAIAHRWGYVSTIDSDDRSARTELIESAHYPWSGPFALSPDTRLLAYCDREPKGLRLVIRDLTTNKENRVDLPATLLGMISLHDEETLALAYASEIEFRNWSDGQRIGNLQTNMSIDTLAVSSDGELLVGTSSFSGKVVVWNLRSHEEIATLTLSNLAIRDIAVSRDGKYLAAAGYDGKIYVLNAQDDSFPVHATLEGHKSAVFGLAFSSKSNLLASSGRDSTIRIWDVETKTPRYILRGHSQIVSDVHFLEDGDTVVSCGDTSVRFWRLSECQPLRHTTKPIQISEAVFSDDEQLHFYEYQTTKLRTVDVQTWREEEMDVGFRINALNYSPHVGLGIGGTRGELAVLKADQTIQRIDTGSTESVWSIRVSPNGQYLVAGTKDRVHTWKVAGNRFRKAHGFDGFAWSVALTDELVAHGDDGGIAIHHLDSGREISRWRGHNDRVYRLAFSRDGKRLLSCSLDGTIKIWSPEGKLLSSISAASRQWCAIYSHDEQSVLSTGDDGYAVLRDARTLEEVFRFPQLKDGGICVALSPGGRWLAVNTISGDMKVCDLGRGERIGDTNAAKTGDVRDSSEPGTVP